MIVALADGGRLPAIYPDRCFSEQGGLTSYGADDPDLYRHAGILVAQILRGAGPGDLPFYQASRFELVVNLKTAKALGLAVPRSLLARADELID